jgi:hypothetical protein
VLVSDERVNIEAGGLEWTLDGTRMVAQNQRQERAPSPAPARPARKAVKRPAMLTADQPINVTSANMTYNQQTGPRGVHRRRPVVAGATSIRAKTITLDDSTGNLTAKDTVRSVMRVETKTSAKPEAPVAGKPATVPAPTTAATTPATTTTAAAAAPASAAAAAKTQQARCAGERYDRHRQRAGLRRRRAARPLHGHRAHGRRAR